MRADFPIYRKGVVTYDKDTKRKQFTTLRAGTAARLAVL